MNREFWKQRFFTAKDPLYYPCPNCKQGVFKPIYGKVVQKLEEIYQNDPPIEYIGTVMLKCTHCHYPIAMITDRVDACEEDYDEEAGIMDFKEVKSYIPKFIYPPLPIIRCDYRLPKKIRKRLELSFILYYYDLESCAAALRKTIELILSDKKIQKDNLKDKIDSIENEWLKTLFTGIKEMGNAGTHGNYDEKKIDAEDILDGYELLEAILDELYYKRQEVLEKKANSLKEKFPNPNKKDKSCNK